MMHTNRLVSPQKDASVKSNVEETRNSDVTVHTSNMDTNIINCEMSSTSVLESTKVITPQGPTTKSNMEEGRYSIIIENLSNKV